MALSVHQMKNKKQSLLFKRLFIYIIFRPEQDRSKNCSCDTPTSHFENNEVTPQNWFTAWVASYWSSFQSWVPPKSHRWSSGGPQRTPALCSFHLAKFSRKLHNPLSIEHQRRGSRARSSRRHFSYLWTNRPAHPAGRPSAQKCKCSQSGSLSIRPTCCWYKWRSSGQHRWGRSQLPVKCKKRVQRLLDRERVIQQQNSEDKKLFYDFKSKEQMQLFKKCRYLRWDLDFNLSFEISSITRTHPKAKIEKKTHLNSYFGAVSQSKLTVISILLRLHKITQKLLTTNR